jgi:hypothetical protein
LIGEIEEDVEKLSTVFAEETLVTGPPEEH